MTTPRPPPSTLAMEIAQLPEYDFDGNEVPICTSPGTISGDGDTRGPNGPYEEVSRIMIHHDLDTDENDGGDGESNLTDEPSIQLALQEARARVQTLENKLATHRLRSQYPPTTPHHQHALAPNTTHLAHHPHDPQTPLPSNQFFSPIVPVTQVLHEVELQPMNGHGGILITNGNVAIDEQQKNGTTVAGGPSAPVTPMPTCFSWGGIVHYFKKWQGQHVALLPMSSWWDILLAFIGSWIGIAVPALFNFNMLYAADKLQYIFIIASFGATAVLVYSVPMSDFSQPRNVIGGHTLSAIMGVIARHIVFPHEVVNNMTDSEFFHREWLACALAVSLAIVIMNLTRTIHPPGGASALQAVLVNQTIHNLDWSYIGFIMVTASTMTFIGLIMNNLPRKRIYPKYWF